jgi:hypothetical protein
MKKIQQPNRVPRPKIPVTAEIIDKACQRNSHRCMIADAIRSYLPNASAIVVDMIGIRFSDPEKGLRYFYPTPMSAQAALVGFDMGKVIPPFVLYLKGGQVASRTIRNVEGKLRQVHKFGRRKFTAEKEANGGTVTEIVGGKLPPHRTPPHPSRTGLREFGVKNFSGDFVKGWVDKSL